MTSVGIGLNLDSFVLVVAKRKEEQRTTDTHKKNNWKPAQHSVNAPSAQHIAIIYLFTDLCFYSVAHYIQSIEFNF